MNFPDVPFDESLFEANQMMKTYWERSTENRNVEFNAPRADSEDELPTDLAELRALSMEALAESMQAEAVEAPVEAIVEVPVAVKAVIDAPVLPKQLFGGITNTQAVGIGIILILAIIIIIFSINHYRSRNAHLRY